MWVDFKESTLWEWLSEQDVTVGIPSIAIKPPYENDKGIMQVYTDHLRSNLEEDDRLNLQHIEEGQDVEVNTAVQEARRKVEELREKLTKHDLIWLSDLTNSRTPTPRDKSNRSLRQNSQYKYNCNDRAAWIKTLYGVPGLLTNDKKCDFSLGGLIQYEDTSQTDLVYDKFQNNEGWYDFANLQAIRRLTSPKPIRRTRDIRRNDKCGQ